ncbi:hypothetical protein RHMOL_Rhmol02G0054200 [Rhododendron molle]|uniref:Uncharacterized protein n=1 Tax=Rhododendron molle TaxID=49168 RepID=A0ACC0PN68_RHOML|nr:hypothetical protein RHMOL_Rhmol02G0054200 [Rhododendron molle]
MGLVAEGFAMNNLSSLVEASIDFELCYDQVEDRYDTAMTELLHGISNVQTLYLSGDCIAHMAYEFTSGFLLDSKNICSKSEVWGSHSSVIGDGNFTFLFLDNQPTIGPLYKQAVQWQSCTLIQHQFNPFLARYSGISQLDL